MTKNVLQAGLPEAANPFTAVEGECPWARHARVDRSNWAAVLGPQLIVTDQAVARSILADPRFRPGTRVAMQQNPAIDPRFLARRLQTLLLRDGPDHARMRGLSARAFTPRAADRHRPFMREVMHRLADGVPADGVCDAVATLTQTYPIFVICEVLGAPSEDVPMFSRVAETILSAQTGAPDFLEIGLAAHDELDGYVSDLIARRRTDPRPDLLTDLIQAEEGGGRLTTEEMLHIVVSVIMAGTDTTSCMGANLARAELFEALSVLRTRFTAIEHNGSARFRRVGFIDGPVELPLRLTHSTAAAASIGEPRPQEFPL